MKLSLFVPGAIFGNLGLSLFLARPIFGDLGWSLFVAGTIFGEVRLIFCLLAGAQYFFSYKMRPDSDHGRIDRAMHMMFQPFSLIFWSVTFHGRRNIW